MKLHQSAAADPSTDVHFARPAGASLSSRRDGSMGGRSNAHRAEPVVQAAYEHIDQDGDEDEDEDESEDSGQEYNEDGFEAEE